MTVPVHDRPDALPLSTWLDVLRAVFPPRAVIAVGAGSGNGSLLQWLRSRHVHQVCVVEGDANQYSHLLRQLPEGAGWTPRCDVVAPAAGPAVFYRASNPAESGLFEPERLRMLWPNLSKREAIDIDTAITLEGLLAEAGEHINWLMLDCLPAAPLLQSGLARFDQIDVVVARVAVAEHTGLDHSAHLAAADELLSGLGFMRVHQCAERHPALARAIYVRSPTVLRNQLDAARTERAALECALQEQRQKTQAELDALSRTAVAERAVLSEQLRQLQQDHEQLRNQFGQKQAELEASRTKQAHLEQRLAEQRHEAEQHAERLANQLAQAQAQVQAAHAERSALEQDLHIQLAQARQQAVESWHKVDEILKFLTETRDTLEELKQVSNLTVQQPSLEKLLETSNANVDKWCKSIKTSIEREVSNAVKQIEAFNAIQAYLATGDLLPSFHGWSVSPDFALLIIELLEHNKFDAVIEFGSGSSTLLVARALTHLSKKYSQRQRPVQVAFEHLPEFHDRTAELLRHAGLRDEVKLVLAPLKPMTLASGDVASFYDPGNALVEVAQLLENIVAPRILAIVDGPPEATGPVARYPSLELLLKVFPRQHGYFLLDDYRRPGEQQTIRMWDEFLRTNNIDPVQTEYELEKRACLIEFDASQRVIEGEAS
ncbi:hypothetical protein [Caldimonas sp.]|uniref:hypothetical protein n=1 Tax=Caldimonas sp. TaxID=2838790 RepID=UPI00307EEA25